MNMLLLKRIRAFVIRDFHLAVSYRLEFILKILWILGIVTTFYFIAQIFRGMPVTQYAQWHDPLAAWLTGIAMLSYFTSGFSSLANAIRQEQMQGTLESVLLTPINVPTVVVATSAWAYVEATVYSALYLFFGWLFFDVQYRGSIFLALVFLILTTLVLASLGILSASFAMVFKRGDPFAILLGVGSAMFSGVFFPKEMLQQALGQTGGQIVSFLIPATHGLDGIRAVLIQGKTLSEVTAPLFTLLIFLGILGPFSLWVFGRAIKRAKKEGSLIQY
jgi:ABC-2 type transport system permease protein